MRNAIRELAVVIPARNEEALIGACLDAMQHAIAIAHRHLGRRAPRITITVVADGCDDATASIVRQRRGVSMIELPPVGVGAARRTGVALVLSESACDPEALWLANTDADSTVASNWILEQLAGASGADVLVGTVEPVMSDLSVEQQLAWHATHRGDRATGHVHGANLGVRASAYLAAGGFARVEEHEDVDLVARIRLAGSTVTATAAAQVLTSGRQSGRTPGGYAGYLRELGAAPDAENVTPRTACEVA